MKPSEYLAFKEALEGKHGELDAWLECNSEAEVKAAIAEHARAIEAATLERAAEIADDMDYDPDGSIAKTIRAMKGKEE